MRVQLTENILATIFVETDDLLQAWHRWAATHLFSSVLIPKRSPHLYPSEMATIHVAYHLSGYKCFEYFYRDCLLKDYLHAFPKAPSYKRFVSYTLRLLPLLLLLLLYKCSQSIRTGHYFLDSKKLEVCHLRRENSHRVFAGYGRKGKSSTGWFFGLKLHLVINHMGQIVSALVTAGNVADNNKGVLAQLLSGLTGKCAADKGYYTTLFASFYEQGLHLLLKPKKNMASLPASASDVLICRKRPVIESVNDILTTVCNVEHTRHRNPFHGLANIYAALIAYQYLPAKPHVFIPNAQNYIQQAA